MSERDKVTYPLREKIEEDKIVYTIETVLKRL